MTFNCKNVTVDCVRKLSRVADVIALQEIWLLPHDLVYLGSIDDSFALMATSAVDAYVGILRGRPYGSVALLWRKDVLPRCL